MSNLSRKHHYIPQFYLKGFCRRDNTFSVYDKEYDHFRNDPQSPASNFFERYRNTIKVNGVKTDKIERLYRDLETQFSQLFELIQSGAHQKNIITKEGVYLLKTFIAIQFWRLPTVDSFANDYAKNFDLKKIGKGITFDGVPIGDIEEINHLLKTNNDFQYYFRCFYLPILTFDIFSNNHCLDNWYIFNVEDKSKWAKQICGDNPIVIEDIESFMKFSGILIFPLTKSRVLIHSPIDEKLSELEPSFSSMLSLLILTQSQKYICGPDQDYISEIVNIFKRTRNKINPKALYKNVLSHIK